MKTSLLRQALHKQFRKTITDKIITFFEYNYSNMSQGSLNFQSFFEMLQVNLMQPCTVTKNWSVPRYFKLFF